MPPMSYPRYATLALTLFASSIASAQTSTTTSSTTYVGTCTGNTSSSSSSTTTSTSTLSATISFAARTQSDIDKGSSNLSSIYSTYAPNVFGKSECDCDPQEDSQDGIYMVIQISSAFDQGTNTNATAWVGSGCDTYTTRVNSSAVSCRQFQPTNLAGQDFVAGSGYTVTNPLYMWVPARLLFDPITGTCGSNAANSIWIFIGNNQQTPDATCQISLSEISVGSSPAVNPTANSGDSAVNISWEVPTVSNSNTFIQVSYFQLLCADEDGNPIKDNPEQAYYSTCTSAGLQRRQNIFGESGVTAVGDGGTTDDAGTTEALKTGPLALPEASSDAAIVDMATPVDMASSVYTDTSIRPETHTGIDPFGTLDQKYICSAAIAPSATTQSVRVGGLTNGKNYKFVIVSIDDYGNATPSELITATPQPAEDLYGALRSNGSKAHGFCFVATAAFGDYDHPQVRTLRAFRDRVLETSAAGRWFIHTYYRLSPPLAHFIEQGAGRRFVARMLLWPLVAFAELAIALHSVVLAFLFFIGVGFLARRYRRHRREHALTLTEAAAS